MRAIVVTKCKNTTVLWNDKIFFAYFVFLYFFRNDDPLSYVTTKKIRCNDGAIET